MMIGVVVLAALLVAFGRPHGDGTPKNTLIVESQSAPDHLDTALSYQIVSWQMELNAYDGLLTYRKTSGLTGSQLVPDLAAAMPTTSPDGLTWTFRMRTGVHWGPPLHRDVEPSDIKWGMERLFQMASPGSGFYTGIVDAKGYQKRAEAHAKNAKAPAPGEIAGIVADDAAHTIAFHLTKPNPILPYLLSLPFSFAVPKETPATEQGQRGNFIPATGPYMFAKYVPNELIRLVRNPNFRQYSPNTPHGNVDGIDMNVGVDPENAVTLIKNGQADYMIDQIPRSKMAVLLNDPAMQDRVKVSPTARTWYLFMNTQIAPFNNVKVRQAVEWAIDRNAMAKLNGGTIVASETILPPAMPGYRKHDLYPKPDLGKARALIAASGIRKGIAVDFWCMTDDTNQAVAQYMQGVLDQLGFVTQTKCVDKSGYRSKTGAEATKAQIGEETWSQDYPEASDFIDVLLNGERIVKQNSNNESWFNDPAINRQIDVANDEPVQAKRNAMWGALDREIMEQAPIAPYGYGVIYSFISKRLQNYVVNPVYGVLFSQVRLGSAPSDGSASGAAGSGS